MNVILDTNSFLLPFEFGIDVIFELEKLFGEDVLLTSFMSTSHELESLLESKLSLKKQKNVKMALKYIAQKRKRLNMVSNSTDTYTDDAIVKFAQSFSGSLCVMTEDRALIDRIKNIRSDVKFVIMRQKKYLVVQE